MGEKQIQESIDQPPEKKSEKRSDLGKVIGRGARVRVRVSIQNFHGDFIVGAICGQIP